MEKIALKNFKAHEDLEIKFAKKNFVLYGDNGSGKSSIYDAFRLMFFKKKVESRIKLSSTPEQQTQEITDFYSGYNHKISNNDFEVKFNDVDWKIVEIDAYRVFMLNSEDIFFDKYLFLDKLINKVHFNLLENNENNFAVIVGKVNEYLKLFQENITLELDIEDQSIKITDEVRGLRNIKDIKRYYNEAKINLVVLLLLFSVVELSKQEDKKNILILDDFITSLDMANRTFLMTHVLKTFKDFQIVIFTHSIHFYNLILFLENEIIKSPKGWHVASLYEIDNKHKVYSSDSLLKLDKIKENYNTEKRENNPNFANVGNQLRQKFETLLHELSKILMIGGVEESKKILDKLTNQSDLYLINQNNKIKNSIDLVNEISAFTTITEVHSRISDYRLDGLSAIKDIIKNLKIYQKVSMHTLSHGRLGLHEFRPKEIEQTFLLLEQLEKNLSKLPNKNIDGQ